MFSADFVNLAKMKARATMLITTTENKASCDM
jgi:hypothetical protein